MRIFFLIVLSVSIYSCAGKQGVYWCGDHPCINKAEKEAYFKKTMIVEFREIKKKDKKEQTKLNKIIEQAKKDEKKRISDEKALKKQISLSTTFCLISNLHGIRLLLIKLLVQLF